MHLKKQKVEMIGMTNSKLNESSQSYVDMLNLTSVDQLTDYLRDKAGNSNKARLTSQGILRIIRKHKIDLLTIAGVKFLTPYSVDKFMEKQTKCYGSIREDKSTISTARLHIVTKESKSEKLRDLVRKQKQKISDEMSNKK